MTTPTTTPSLDQRINATISRSYTIARPGFSLIELTAVLVIIGLLMAGAAVAVPRYLERARVRVTKTSMTTIKTAITTYMADNAGSAPESVLMLVPNYIEEGTEKDAWDLDYYYSAPGQTHAYELISAGPDKQFQTSDDINLWTMDVNSAN